MLSRIRPSDLKSSGPLSSNARRNTNGRMRLIWKNSAKIKCATRPLSSRGDRRIRLPNSPSGPKC